MKFHFLIVTASFPLISLIANSTIPLEPNPDCLYAFTQGNDTAVIQPCGEDIKRIGTDRDVLEVLRTFSIPTELVVFQACPGGRFSAMPSDTSAGQFFVRYPSAVKDNYLAPIAHELAHVVQMRDAGGLEPLKAKTDLRQIELGADFLAGLAFDISLKNMSSLDFETNLQLVGSYTRKAKDHGTPEDRTVAFRRGSNRKYPYQQLTILESLRYWYANDYPRIRH